MNDGILISRGSVRLSASLLIIGQLSYVAATLLHAGGDANDHQAIFSTYAENAIWTGVHLAQFLGVALIIGGLFALTVTLSALDGAAKWAARLGTGAAVAALALYGALQAVDGVALKQAVMAWASAPEVEKAARFATAESIRWLEWGMRSYQDFAMGISLLLSALAVGLTSRFSRIMALIIGLTGIAYLVQGWIAGTEGFTDSQSKAIIASWVLGLAWMVWLAFSATKKRGASRTTRSESAAAAA
ncbi:MAG: hypothetical protein ACTHOI_11175 [Sphingomicrobium sp.]